MLGGARRNATGEVGGQRQRAGRLDGQLQPRPGNPQRVVQLVLGDRDDLADESFADDHPEISLADGLGLHALGKGGRIRRQRLQRSGSQTLRRIIGSLRLDTDEGRLRR